MGDATNENVDLVVDTRERLREMINDQGLSKAERAEAQKDLSEIARIVDKLDANEVEIAVFGEVNSGKSSLLNAMLGQDLFDESAEAGKTKERGSAEWRPIRRTTEGHSGSKLVLVDTPGINEVDGKERAKIAEETVRTTDLVIFCCASDLNEVEFSALKELAHLNKPLILALTKVDTLSKTQLQQMHESVRGKVQDFIHDDSIVFVAARPIERERVIIGEDGSERSEMFAPKPEISDLEERVLQVLATEEKAIVALNAGLFASDVSDRLAKVKVKLRKESADRVVHTCMVIKAIAVGCNPIPVVDVIGGLAPDVEMVRRLGKVYGQSVSIKNCGDLIREIAKVWAAVGSIEVLTHLGASLVKTLTVGVGTAITAVPQGLAAAWGSYVIGQAASIYFREGGWGERGPKAIVEEILATTDRDSVLAPVKAKILSARKSGQVSADVSSA
ncbi:MAG: GTP-binding protein [Pseudomonadota bacterium]